MPQFRPILPPPAPDHDPVRVLVNRIQLELPVVWFDRFETDEMVQLILLRPQKCIDRLSLGFSASLPDLRNCIGYPALTIGIERIDGGIQGIQMRKQLIQSVVILLPGLKLRIRLPPNAPPIVR